MINDVQSSANSGVVILPLFVQDSLYSLVLLMVAKVVTKIGLSVKGGNNNQAVKLKEAEELQLHEKVRAPSLLVDCNCVKERGHHFLLCVKLQLMPNNRCGVQNIKLAWNPEILSGPHI